MLLIPPIKLITIDFLLPSAKPMIPLKRLSMIE